MTTSQWILFIYLILFYGLAFFWRSYQTWRATGVNPYRLDQGSEVQRFAGRWYRLISAGVAGSVLIYAFAPSWYSYLAPLTWLEATPIAFAGMTLLLFALIWVLVAQTQMGSSWRIGIDEENPTALVTQGVFRISRNPIFLGMRANLLGLFLVIPNALTLALWLLGDLLLQIQVYLEEDYLKEAHGTAYTDYCRHVRRWF